MTTHVCETAIALPDPRVGSFAERTEVLGFDLDELVRCHRGLAAALELLDADDLASYARAVGDAKDRGLTPAQREGLVAGARALVSFAERTVDAYALYRQRPDVPPETAIQHGES